MQSFAVRGVRVSEGRSGQHSGGREHTLQHGGVGKESFLRSLACDASGHELASFSVGIKDNFEDVAHGHSRYSVCLMVAVHCVYGTVAGATCPAWKGRCL